MNKALLVFCGMVLLFGCSLSKKSTKATTNKALNEIINTVHDNHINWEWFGTRSRTQYDDGSQNIAFSSTIRLKRDETIWMSASKLGIEIARVMITPDSIFMMNRWDKEYAIASIDDISSYTSVPISFTDIQNIVLGNPVKFEQGDHELNQLSEKYLVFYETNELKNLYWFTAGDLLLNNMQMIDKVEDQEVFVSLNDYREVSQKQLAHQRDVHFKGDKTINIEMDYSRIKVNEPLEFPFNIPSSYTRVY